MNAIDLRTHIAHRLADVPDNALEEVNTMLDFKISEPIIRCSDEQRRAIALAKQAIAKGEKVYHKDVQKAVELCLNEN